jgi:hypothetical protein
LNGRAPSRPSRSTSPQVEGLRRLRAFCKPGARVSIVFGYDAASDPDAAGLPAVDQQALETLAAHYREAGLAITARPLPLAEACALPTTWAARLTWSGKPRPFVELCGQAE